MSQEPLMFRSRKKKSKKLQIISIVIAFCLLGGAVKIFGLNITGNMIAQGEWANNSVPGAQGRGGAGYSPDKKYIQENDAQFFSKNSTNKTGAAGGAGASGSKEIVGTVPGIVPILNPFSAELKNTTLSFENETTLNFAVSITGREKIRNFTVTSENFIIENGSFLANLLPGERGAFAVTLKTNQTDCAVVQDLIKITGNRFSQEFPVTAYVNGALTAIGAYYNRSMPQSTQYEFVPVPGAEVLLSSNCGNSAAKITNSSGLADIFHPKNETTLTILAPGFIVNKHAQKTISGQEQAAHFFLTISKAKISMQNSSPFIMGRQASTTLAVQATFPDTILQDFKEVPNTIIDAALIKEVNEDIFELSPHSVMKANLTEATKLISLNVSTNPNLYGSDLYMPKLHLKLLTSTNDLIYEKKEKVHIGFLEANLSGSTITLENPTSRPIKGVLLSSEIFNEHSEKLSIGFSENNFDIPPGFSKSIAFETGAGSGNFTGNIIITGTLPAAGAGWDEPAADTFLLSFAKDLPIHDVSIKAKAPLVFSNSEKEIALLLSNCGNFTEAVDLILRSGNITHASQVILNPLSEKMHKISFDFSALPLGTNNFSIFALVPHDFNPGNNQQNFSIYLSQAATPKNVVLLIFDGAGSAYFNDLLTPRTMELKSRGFSSENLQVRIPSTTESHSIMFTSKYNKDWDWRAFEYSVSLPNSTLFDSARSAGYKVLGVMGQGDFEETRGKMDAILSDQQADWADFKSTLTINGNITAELQNIFAESNNLSAYKGKTNSSYVDYGQWEADSITSLLGALAKSPERFLLVSNFAGTDHAGHSRKSDYEAALAGADIQISQIVDTLLETRLLESTILIITADHGMCFAEGTYGEYGFHASCQKDEARIVPFIMIGPAIAPSSSGSLAHTDDITPTIESIFAMPKQENSTGRVLKEIFSPINDAGITSLSTSPIAVGSDAITTITVKNYGVFSAAATVCFNSTFSLSCGQVSLLPNEEKLLSFHWKTVDSGVYKLSAELREADENLHNNFASQTLKTGIVQDLGVGSAWYTLTNESYDNNTIKVLLNVEVCNLGSLAFDEKLLMGIITDNCTGDVCSKTYNLKFSAAPGNCNKYKSDLPFGLKKGVLQTISFRMSNLTDMDMDNNYKKLVTVPLH